MPMTLLPKNYMENMQGQTSDPEKDEQLYPSSFIGQCFYCWFRVMAAQMLIVLALGSFTLIIAGVVTILDDYTPSQEQLTPSEQTPITP